MDANTYPAEPHSLPPSGIWYGFSAGPAAWTLQGLVAVIVSAQFCPADVPNWGLLDQNGVRLVLGLITLGLLAVAISGGLVSLRNWHRLAGDLELARAEGRTREAFMSLGGVLMSIVFSLGILWAGIPLIMLQVCMRAR